KLAAGLVRPHIHTIEFDLWYSHQGTEPKMARVKDAHLGLILFLIGNGGPIFVGTGSFLERAKRLLADGAKLARYWLGNTCRRVDEEHTARVSIGRGGVFLDWT